MLYHVSIFISFIAIVYFSVLLYGSTTTCLFIHLLMNIFSLQFGAFENKTSMNNHVQVFVCTCFFFFSLLVKYL